MNVPGITKLAVLSQIYESFENAGLPKPEVKFWDGGPSDGLARGFISLGRGWFFFNAHSFLFEHSFTPEFHPCACGKPNCKFADIERIYLGSLKELMDYTAAEFKKHEQHS